MRNPIFSRFLGLAHGLASEVHLLQARLSGVQVGRDCRASCTADIALDGSPPRRGTVILGDRTRIETGVALHPYGGSIETGVDVYLGPYTVVYGQGGIKIGKDTLISMHCRILSSNHRVPAVGTIMRSVGDELLPTSVGCDVWLGAGVTVLGGVTIGDGCVVGAGAVVTRSLPPGSISVGVPARVVRPRR